MKTHPTNLLLPNDLNFGTLREQCNCGTAWNLETITDITNLNGDFVRASGAECQIVNNEYRLAYNSLAGCKAVLVTSAGWDMLESYTSPRVVLPGEDRKVLEKMLDLGFLILNDNDQGLERKPIQTTVSAWLHLTDRCNLRCSYCYLPHVREDMTPETGRAAVEATFRSAVAGRFTEVLLKYAGGEPLLRWPLILELHEYAQSLADRHGLQLREVVLSNGTLLTGEMAARLRSLGISLMISLDGLGKFHDSQRPYAGGRGSFRDASEAVDLALANGLAPDISVTISGRTAEGLPALMEWILARDLPFSLNFYRENGLSASHTDLRLDGQKIIAGMLAAFQVIESNLPRRPFLGGIIDRADLSALHTHACGAGQNYLVFDQHGAVAQCQMLIRRPVTGLAEPDPLEAVRSYKEGLLNLPVTEKEGCNACQWRHWCAGGCPLETHRVTGRYDVKSPNCSIYKALFPEALRLEGLRLLKYQDDPEVVLAI